MHNSDVEEVELLCTYSLQYEHSVFPSHTRTVFSTCWHTGWTCFGTKPWKHAKNHVYEGEFKIDGYPSPQAPLLVVMLSPVLVSLFRLLPLFFPFSSRPFTLIFYLGDAEEKENAVPHSDGRTPHDFAGGCRVGIGNRLCKRAEKNQQML